MAGKPGRSGGSRIGAGRKTKAYHNAVASGEIKLHEKRVPEYRDVPCHVYIVHEAGCSNICKIGVAINAAKRFSHLQVGTWRELKLAKTFLFPSEEEAHRVEGHVHRKLKTVHHRGEWFMVELDSAEEAVKVAAEYFGVSFICHPSKQ